MTTQPSTLATESGPGSASTASGLATARNGSSKGRSVVDTTATAAAATVTVAHHRQRGEGGEPVGVSSRMKPRHAAQRTTLKSV